MGILQYLMFDPPDFDYEERSFNQRPRLDRIGEVIWTVDAGDNLNKPDVHMLVRGWKGRHLELICRPLKIKAVSDFAAGTGF
uniref:Uncharacterized protein n=1 Tax=Salix viminalis TaxID=40686 RepID=A0A6N2KZC0_SALVM